MTELFDTADSPMPRAAHEGIAAQVEAGAIAQLRSVFANLGVAAHVGGLASLQSDAELEEISTLRQVAKLRSRPRPAAGGPGADAVDTLREPGPPVGGCHQHRTPVRVGYGQPEPLRRSRLALDNRDHDRQGSMFHPEVGFAFSKVGSSR